ncbi:MAG TPA: hypothetical protein VLX56_02525 [Nitrososphaerales archaeon]|nr:hypothetical protein [Nitrososphaerales archaeon]
MAGSGGWTLRKASSAPRFVDRLVLQRRRRGILDLTVHLAVDGRTSDRALGMLLPLAAASTSEGIRRDTGVVSWLHWPDLVTIEGRAVAKATVSVGQRKAAESRQVLMCITVSCFPEKPVSTAPLPPASLLEVLGVEVDLDLLRNKVLHAVNWYHAAWESGLHSKLAERMLPTIPWIGRKVEVAVDGAPALRGVVKGLDSYCRLLLDQGPGQKGGLIAIPPAAEAVRVVD